MGSSLTWRVALRTWTRAVLLTALSLLITYVAEPCSGQGQQEGIELPTVTVTGQARSLIMPEQPPVVRETLGLIAARVTLLPEVKRLRVFPVATLHQAQVAPKSGGCLFGWSLGASLGMVLSPEKSLFRYALTLYTKGRFQESDERLSRLVESYPQSEYVPESLFFRAQIALVQEHYEAACEFLSELSTRFPAHPVRHDALCNLAYALHRIEDTPRCIGVLSQLILDYPDSPKANSARHARASLLFAQEDYAAAAEDFEYLAEAASDSELKAEYTFWVLESLYCGGEYDRVLLLADQTAAAFQETGLQPRFLFTCASALDSLGRTREAAGLYAEIARSFPESEVASSALFRRARILREADELAEAESALTTLVQRYRTSQLYCDALLSLGWINVRLSRFRPARSWLVQAEQMCSSDEDISSRIYYLLGLNAASSKRLSEAQGYFERASQQARDPAVKAASNLGLGWCHFESGRYKTAAHSFSSAISVNPPDRIRLEALFWAGQAHLKTGDFGRAEQLFQAIVDSESASPEMLLDARIGLAFAHFLKSDWREAEEHFRVITQSERPKEDRAISWLRMAQCEYYLGKYGLGAEYAGKAAELTETNATGCGAGLVRGKCLLRLGQRDEALELLDSLPNNFPGCEYLDDARYAIATSYFEDGEFKRSVKAFKDIISSFPDSELRPKAFLGIANSFYNRGDYNTAAGYYEKVLESEADVADNKSALYGLVFCYQRQGRLQEFEARIDTFMERFKDPKMAGTLRALLAEEMAQKKQYFGAIGQYHRAFRGLEQANADEDELAEILYRIGQIMELTGDLKGAISEYDQLVFRFRGNRHVRMARLRQAGLFVRLEDTKRAITIYSSLAEQYPDDVDVAGVSLLRHAELVKKSDAETSLRLCKTAASKFPNTAVAADCHILSAEILLGKKRFSEARSNLEKAKGAVAEQAKKAYVDYLYGHSYFEEGDFAEASSALMRVRYLHPTSSWAPKALLEAAKGMEKTGRQPEAKKVYQAILRDYPDDKAAISQAQSSLAALASPE